MLLLFKVQGLVIFISLLSLSEDTNNWELARDKNDIQVFTKKTEGEKLKDSKATSVFDASVEDIVDVLLDFDNYTDWIPSCKESSTLKKISDNEYYYYSVYAAPWPVADRDLIAHIKVKRNPNDGSVFIELKGVPDYIPERNKKVRIPSFYGTWKLVKLDSGKVRGTNEYSTDPGGSLPKWLVNSAAVDNPYDTFKNLKERLNLKD